jgi:hypothetical protein
LLATSQIGCNLRHGLQGPGADRPAGSVDAPLREHFLHIAEAQRETEVRPSGVLNDGCREPMPFARNSRHWDLPNANDAALPETGQRWSDTPHRDPVQNSTYRVDDAASLLSAAITSSGDILTIQHLGN